MAILISSSSDERLFQNKDIINVGSMASCDFVIKTNQDMVLTIQFDSAENKYTVINTFNVKDFLFKGQPFSKIQLDNVCKIMIANSEEFIKLKIVSDEVQPIPQKTVSTISGEDFTEDDIKGLYAGDINPATRIKIEKQKSDIEQKRVAIVKQVAFTINDLRAKISTNFKTTIFLHIAMFFSALVCSFGVSNYLMGLSITESKNLLHLPANIKVLWIYAILIYGLCLLLKQGVYLFLLNKTLKNVQQVSKIAENFMLVLASIFMVAIYTINLIYYLNIKGFVIFAILISLFFVGVLVSLAIGCGYFKYNSTQYSMELDKYEYRPDFESVIKEYQLWIERYLNNLSKGKIQYIKDKIFTLQLKSVGEIIVGILTAPFLAYGVSNTLASCFPEAAGWIRISGLRFSPVFLVLATFMIIFAFFAFVNAFLCTKKVQASQVIKQDGFSDYQDHGVMIYGIQAVRKINSERIRSLCIGIAIIFIEFTMNVSYFMSEIGGDFQGISLSIIAALVPTALLIAETYMLSQTNFEIYALDCITAKIDKD